MNSVVSTCDNVIVKLIEEVTEKLYSVHVLVVEDVSHSADCVVSYKLRRAVTNNIDSVLFVLSGRKHPLILVIVEVLAD